METQNNLPQSPQEENSKTSVPRRRKPLYKQWWFWVVLGIVTLAIALPFAESPETSGSNTSAPEASITNQGATSSKTEPGKTEPSYTVVDLRTLLDELDENALRAESKYQDARVEVTGRISTIDSDGSYISIKPVDADSFEYLLVSVTCRLRNNAQRDFVITKNVGDTVTVKGTITSIGEILGYTIKIDSIS